MGTIDELRALLEERGVEYRVLPDSHTTHVWFGGIHVCEQGNGKLACYDLAPAQAIEATLGRGECHDEGFAPYFFGCSNCGASHLRNVAYVDMPNYCPRCGAKVVTNG